MRMKLTKRSSLRCLSSTHPRHLAAFSLVELVVVMVIIGLLSSLVAIRARAYIISSRQNAAQAEISTIVKALESFYAYESRYPSSEEGLAVLTQPTANLADGLIDKVPSDPWGRPYEYISPGATSPYEVICLGADGREGGENADKDITSESLGDG